MVQLLWLRPEDMRRLRGLMIEPGTVKRGSNYLAVPAFKGLAASTDLGVDLTESETGVASTVTFAWDRTIKSWHMNG